MTTENDATTAKEAAPEADEQSVVADMQFSVATIMAAIVTAIKATSLRPPPERVVVEEMPTADSKLDVQEFDEADETEDYVTKHSWERIHDRLTCNKCQALWTETNREMSCSIADGERALTQLGGCLLAAEGQATGTPGGTPGATKGDYGWSPAFQAVRDLRAERDKLAETVPATDDTKVKVINGLREALKYERVASRTLRDTCQRFHDEKAELKIEGDRLRMSLEHCRQATMENFDANSLPATGEEGVELHAFTAVRELRGRYDVTRDKLEAERTASADKVQIIDRQCQERRTIKEAVEKSDMAGLRAILFPPESDEPESVKEPETKTVVLDAGPDHLNIVEIENVTALRAERDQLLEYLGTCEWVAMEDSTLMRCTGAAAVEAVSALGAKCGRMRKAIAGLRETVIAGIRCTCVEDEGDPPCPISTISTILRDFEKQAGVAEAKGPERDDVTSPAAAEEVPGPCDPERIKDKLVIRFDSLPGPKPAGFVETELNGKGVHAGEWVQDGEYWLLVINDYDPKVIADLSRENSRLKAMTKNFRDELAAGAMQGLIAHGDYWGESARKRILAFNAYLYADEMMKQR